MKIVAGTNEVKILKSLISSLTSASCQVNVRDLFLEMSRRKLDHPLKDLSGLKIDRLQVIGVSHRGGYEGRMWYYKCLCDCGNECVKSHNYLTRKNRKDKSCGCAHLENTIKQFKKHGHSRTREYRIWSGIKLRCLNPIASHYDIYGGRGIKMCDRWLNSFENFLTDMGYAPSPKHSIDRINNDGDYTPENCRWATQKEQLNNTSRTIHITYNGKTQTLKQWSEELGLNYSMVRHHFRYRGRSLEEIVKFYKQKGVIK